MMVRFKDTSMTGSSPENGLTAMRERPFRITGSFVERTSFGSDDGFDSSVRITLPAHYPGHRLERGFQSEFKCHNQLVFNINNFVSRRIDHLPTVAGFGSVITGIIVRIREGLLPGQPGIFFHRPQGVIVHKLFLFQFGANSVVNALLRFRRIGGP